MGSNSTSQLSAATALVELLKEHPELPVANWQIGSIVPDLTGFLYGGMSELVAYVDVLGGQVRAAEHTYTVRGREVRRHCVKAVWRDVPIEVGVAVPVAVEAVAA
ncbi:hypothetical protein AB0J38_26125 [Streptomyces sp. NPDC050095]|uniref:hypothetical protein n=1 Tax=unclassified Streptomyces TaxID=2593676 RepID=UPI00344073E0